MKLDIERDGLGHRAVLTAEGIGIYVDRIVETRGEMHGELTVARAPEGHLLQARFNLSSMTSRKSTAAFLEGVSPLGKGPKGPTWVAALEAFCVGVLAAERESASIVKIGRQAPRGAPEMVLDPFILGGTKSTVLYGAGGSGKSTLAAAAAVAVQTGVSTFAGWTVPRPRPVLVLDWEADERDWNDLIVGVAEGIGVPAPEIDYWPCDQNLPAMLHELAREIRSREIGLVIVDSVGHAMPNTRDGASAEEGAIRMFKALRMLGCPALLIDHVAKDDGDGRKSRGPYGSVYKWNSVRAAWELRAGEDERAEGDATHLALVHRKHNLTARHRPIGIRLSRSDGHVLLIREDIADDEALAGTMTVAQRLERVLLRSKPMSIGDLAEDIGADPKTVAKTLNRSDRFVKVGQEGRHQMWAVQARLEEPPGYSPPPDRRSSFDALIEANESLRG